MAGAVLVLGSALLLSACISGESEPPETYPDAPVVCPQGFARGLAAELNDIQAAGVVKPQFLGLGSLAPKVACAVRHDSSSTGAAATVIMRAGLSEDDVRHALWDVNFDESADSSMERGGAGRGEAMSVFLHTYGALTSDWRGNRYAFRGMFPPGTVVLEADLRIPHVLKKCKTNGYSAFKAPRARKPAALPTPGPRVVSCRPWTTKEVRQDLDDWVRSTPESQAGGVSCRDVTSYDYNWHNDVLCTREDGSQFYTDYEGADAFLGSQN